MRIIMILLFLFISPVAFASNCIVDKDNNVVSKISYSPNIEDIESRQEHVVKCADDIQIGDADFKNNKVVKHVQTKVEKDAQLAEEQKIATKEAKKQSAVNKLKALGLTDDEINALTGKD